MLQPGSELREAGSMSLTTVSDFHRGMPSQEKAEEHGQSSPKAARLEAVGGRQQVRHTPILVGGARAQWGPCAALASVSFPLQQDLDPLCGAPAGDVQNMAGDGRAPIARMLRLLAACRCSALFRKLSTSRVQQGVI